MPSLLSDGDFASLLAARPGRAIVASDLWASAAGTRCRRGDSWAAAGTPLRGRRGWASEFLQTTEAPLVARSRDGSGSSQYQDFLFGADSQARDGKGPSLQSVALSAPRWAMMAAPLVAGPPGSDAGSSGDDSASELEAAEADSGFRLVIPRGLKLFAVSDALSLLAIVVSRHTDCDAPLLPWLAGGVVLGYPVTALVHRLAVQPKPLYRQYRFRCSESRSAPGAETTMQLDKVKLGDRLGHHLDPALLEYRDGAWFAEFSSPTYVAEYTLITSRLSGSSRRDPVSWTVDASNDGENWTQVDEMNDYDMPFDRGVESEVFRNLQYVEDDASFRFSFTVEVLATAASLAWLVAGTVWVGASTETCVDSAPALWWLSFLHVLVAWSVMGTASIGVILSAVAVTLWPAMRR